MDASNSSLPTYPQPRGGCPYDPPSSYGQWREDEGLTKVELWDGSTTWVATRFELFRKILEDKRFSVDMSLPGMPTISNTNAAPRPVRASMLRLDDPEHARLRRMVSRDFTAPNVEKLRPRIQQICDDLLDEMDKSGPTVDLVASYAQVIPSLITCEILGVPYADHDFFQTRTKRMLGSDSGPEEALAAGQELMAYLTELVESKKSTPGDDTVSRLVTNQLARGELSSIDVVVMALLLLVAGHETSANMIALGTLVLSENPDQMALLRDADDPAFVANAVDQLLRYLSVVDNNLTRVALDDVEVGDKVIRAGEGVILNIPATNRDPRAFEEPDVLDISRIDRERHVAFGHGVHQCLGQVLARVELQVALVSLFRRFPNLRSELPRDQVNFKRNSVIIGLHDLPVTW